MTPFWFRRRKAAKKASRPSYRQQKLLRGRFEKLEDRSLLSAVCVTTVLDVVDPLDNKISLREAIDMANDNTSFPGLDTIILKAGTYKITIGGQSDDTNATGDFDISESVKIVGAQSKKSCTVIDAQALDRVFDIPDATGLQVTFEKVKITGGIADEPLLDVQGGGVRSFLPGNSLSFVNSTVTGNYAHFGGGISSAGGDISLCNSHVDGNNALLAGGGIYLGLMDTIAPLGQITINGSTVNGNTTVTGERSGGGIYSSSTDPFTLNKSQLNNNHTAGEGGGAYLASEEVNITDSCVTGNTAGLNGGGVYIEYGNLMWGAITIKKSTISKNRASLGDGGGLDANGADVTVTCSTVSYNQAGLDGGGIANAFTVEVTGSSFLYNSALQGDGGGIEQELPLVEDGGMAIEQALPQSGDINVSKSTFKGNFAGGLGGGIASVALFDDFTIDVTDSCFLANTAVFDGGGIFAGLHSVNVTCSTFEYNTATSGDGGGIDVPLGSIDVTKSKFLKNTAGSSGGAFSVPDGDVSLTKSTLDGNVAVSGSGGGFDTAGTTVLITESTLSGNRAGGDGGGAYILSDSSGSDASQIVNSTFSGNTAGVEGGGIYFDSPGELTIRFATIAFNRAGTAGGGILQDGAGTLNVQNTIIALNTAPLGPDVFNDGGTLNDQGGNLVYDDTDQNLFTAIEGVDPRLEALADNGGPTKTHALKKDSPAIGNAITGTGITTDQRGVNRDAAPDIGAYEFVPGKGGKKKGKW